MSFLHRRRGLEAHTCPACSKTRALKMDVEKLEVRCRFCGHMTWHMPEARSAERDEVES